MDLKTLHLSIRGVVQGVGFRVHMQREARKLGVTGWVRNRTDGSVEAVVQGEIASVDALKTWAHQGPRSARVSEVQAAPCNGTHSNFEILPTA
jgi:acylphosphatase